MRFKTEKLDWSGYPSWSRLIRKMLMAVFVSYRPELHYMRGPGPKWREKETPGEGGVLKKRPRPPQNNRKKKNHPRGCGEKQKATIKKEPPTNYQLFVQVSSGTV